MAELDDPNRLAELTGPILQLDADGVLEDCVKCASSLADAPLALVTFVMSKIQLFRAAVGLPPELEASRATSRCDSFCQFVVKAEGPFIVTDAHTDDRVPQTMVERYGIRAYLGVPIQTHGQVLGSLCVADGRVRQWPPELVAELTVLAARVSARLEELSIPPDTERQPVVPATLALEVASLAQVIQRSLVEVGPMVRLAKAMSHGIAPDALARAASVLTEASDFYDDMMLAVGELSASSARLEHAMSASSAP